MKHDSTFSRYMLPAEERQLLTTVKQRSGELARRDHAWMRLMRQTGLRVGTVASLKVTHALEALRTGYLIYEDEIAKKGRGGRVYVNKKARVALTDLMNVRRAMGFAQDPEAPLIMSRNHRGMSVRSFQSRMKHWREEAGMPVNASPHWWRHTLSKRIMKNSTSEDPRGVVQSVLNHADPRSTAIYTRPDREEVEQSMEEAS